MSCLVGASPNNSFYRLGSVINISVHMCVPPSDVSQALSWINSHSYGWRSIYIQFQERWGHPRHVTQQQQPFSFVAPSSVPPAVKDLLANSDSPPHPGCLSGDWRLRRGGREGVKEGGGLEVNYRQQRGHRAYYSGAGTCNGPMGMTFTTRARPHPSIAIHTHRATACTPSLTFILRQRQWDR